MLFLLLVDHLVTPGKCHFVHSVLKLESSVSRESSASSVISLCCGATCILVGISLPFDKHESSRHIFACNNKSCPKGKFFNVDAMAPTHLQIYNLEQCGTYVWAEKQILPSWFSDLLAKSIYTLFFHPFFFKLVYSLTRIVIELLNL